MNVIRAVEAQAYRAMQIAEQPGVRSAAIGAGKAESAVKGISQLSVSPAVIVSISVNAPGAPKASLDAASEVEVKRAAASVTPETASTSFSPGAAAYEISMRLTSAKER
jgi:hypothetical protein